MLTSGKRNTLFRFEITMLTCNLVPRILRFHRRERWKTKWELCCKHHLLTSR